MLKQARVQQQQLENELAEVDEEEGEDVNQKVSSSKKTKFNLGSGGRNNSAVESDDDDEDEFKKVSDNEEDDEGNFAKEIVSDNFFVWWYTVCTTHEY